jgi:hypothetical protein
MVGKVEAPEKANMMDPKAVKIYEIWRTAEVLFTRVFYLDAIILNRSLSPKLISFLVQQ